LPEDAVTVVVEDSEAAGAEIAAALLGFPAEQLTIFGITGALGKSTVAAALADLLSACGKRSAALLTEGVYLDGKLTRFENTVADAVELQYLFASLVGQGVKHVALEISSYMLARGKWKDLPLAATVSTDAKSVLPLREVPSTENAFTYGEGGDCFAEGIRPSRIKGGFGTRFTLCLAGEKHSVSLPVPGDFALNNALAVALCAHLSGCGAEEIATALSRIAPWGCISLAASVRGRRIYLDAAYTPEALAAALSAMRERTSGKLVLLLGSVGGRAHTRRAALARAAERYADFVYLTADNPDNEDPNAICEEMASHFVYPWQYVILADRAEAIRRAVLELRPDDTLLIAGKAREGYQLVRGKRLPLDEKALVKTAAKLL
jgi:UDP-N-acetylmuramoyl-L-alanyl-D-glutamate--2,6-diaminopimelate ligase